MFMTQSLSKRAGGFFSILGCGLLCVQQWCFSSPLLAFSLLHPFHCSPCDLSLVCSAVTLTLSQPGYAPGVGRECHFGAHHGNHKQSLSSSSVCCVHSEPFQSCRFSSALQLFICLVGSTWFLFEIRMQQCCGCQVHQLQCIMLCGNLRLSSWQWGTLKLLWK